MSKQKSIEEIEEEFVASLKKTPNIEEMEMIWVAINLFLEAEVAPLLRTTLQSERDRAEEENEGTCRFPIEYKRYIQDCLATDNRKWIEPQFVKLKNSYERGYLNGHNDGYEEGLKENRIIPPEFNPALTNPQDKQ